MAVTLKRVKRAVKSLLAEADSRGGGLRRKLRGEFRASSHGACERKVALTRWASEGRGAPSEEWRLESLFYVAMGNAVHETVQAFLGWKGITWGSWICRYCGHTKVNGKSPGLCCGHPMEYIEYSCVHPDKRVGVDGVYGHIDGIVPMPWGMHYIIIEYKTASLSVQKQRVSANQPYEYTIDQASVYGEFCNAGLVEVIHRGPPTANNHRGEILWRKPAKLPPGKCIGILVIYIPRDNPRMANWTMFFRRLRKGMLKDIETRILKAEKDIRKGRLPPGRCECRADAKDEFNKWCAWTETCFSTHTEEIGKGLYDRAKKMRKERKKGSVVPKKYDHAYKWDPDGPWCAVCGDVHEDVPSTPQSAPKGGRKSFIRRKGR